MTPTTEHARVYTEYLEKAKPFFNRRDRYNSWRMKSIYLVLMWVGLALVAGQWFPVALFPAGVIVLLATPGFLYRRNERRAEAVLKNLSARVVESAIDPTYVKPEQLNWRECYFKLQGFRLHGDIFKLATTNGADGFHVHAVDMKGSFGAVIEEIANGAHWLRVYYGEKP